MPRKEAAQSCKAHFARGTWIYEEQSTLHLVHSFVLQGRGDGPDPGMHSDLAPRAKVWVVEPVGDDAQAPCKQTATRRARAANLRGEGVEPADSPPKVIPTSRMSIMRGTGKLKTLKNPSSDDDGTH